MAQGGGRERAGNLRRGLTIRAARASVPGIRRIVHGPPSRRSRSDPPAAPARRSNRFRTFGAPSRPGSFRNLRSVLDRSEAAGPVDGRGGLRCCPGRARAKLRRFRGADSRLANAAVDRVGPSVGAVYGCRRTHPRPPSLREPQVGQHAEPPSGPSSTEAPGRSRFDDRAPPRTQRAGSGRVATSYDR